MVLYNFPWRFADFQTCLESRRSTVYPTSLSESDDCFYLPCRVFLIPETGETDPQDATVRHTGADPDMYAHVAQLPDIRPVFLCY